MAGMVIACVSMVTLTGFLGEGADQVLDGPGHRGGKEDGLAFLRGLFQDRADVIDEAHVEHAVGPHQG